MIGPPLPEWLRWISDMPASFRSAPEGFEGGTTRVRAVVSDLFESLFGKPADASLLAICVANDAGKRERNRLGWILAACHVLWHPALLGNPLNRGAIERVLIQELAGVAAVLPLGSLFEDEDRREELVRRILRAASCALPGESENQAEDRLRQLDSVERYRVLAAAAEREKRVREVREAIARKAVEEAAAKVSRE